ncbi:hypothetical protein VPHK406_0232 [Vibrio phage K406]
MSHECPYCNAELVYEDTWGVGAHWIRDNNPEGEIYRCPNHEGFEEEEEAVTYLKQEDQYDAFFTSHFSWDEVMCESNIHNVSGMFYTDRSGDLKEGYPC